MAITASLACLRNSIDADKHITPDQFRSAVPEVDPDTIGMSMGCDVKKVPSILYYMAILHIIRGWSYTLLSTETIEKKNAKSRWISLPHDSHYQRKALKYATI